MVTVTGQVISGSDGVRRLRLPFRPTDLFGVGRPPVLVVFDGAVQLRTELVDDGGRGWLEVPPGVVAELGLGVGDQVTAVVEADTDPRPAAWPAALAEALDRDPAAAEAFARLCYSERSAYAAWVAEVRQAAAQRQRAARMVRRLRPGHGGPHPYGGSVSRD